jgi:PTS system mannitol-specific IIA component/PTS system ascorbate-specific IIA component
MKFLEESLIALDVEVDTADNAILLAGQLLEKENLVENSYLDAMLKSYHKNGPYFVLAPQIAMPHARPEDGVNEACVSFIRLKQPVVFGHKSNDPVKFVFALGASSSEEHLKVLQKLMVLLSNKENVDKLETASNYDDIKKLIGGNE